MNNRDVRKQQIKDLVNQFYSQYEVLHRDAEVDLYNKALIRYLDVELTLEEIEVDMQKIVTERLELQKQEEEKMLREKQKEISDFIDLMALQVPNIPQETIEKLKIAYFKDDRDIKEIKAAILFLTQEKVAAQNQKLAMQERIKKIIQDVPRGEEQDYIIYTIAENNNLVREPAKIVSVEKTEHGVHDTMKIIVNDGQFTGYLKSLETSRQNSYELVMSSIGKKLDIPIAESYRVIKDSNEIAIISKEISKNPQEELVVFVDFDKKLLEKLHSNGININPLLEMRRQQFNNPLDINDYKNIIDYNLAIFRAGLSEEEYLIARKQFLESIVFDYLVNQADRNASNYGLIVDKITGEGKRLAELFDNSSTSKPGINADEMTFCNSKVNRHMLLTCLYQYYYDDIQDFSSKLFEKKEEYKAYISNISNEYLDYYESKSFKEKVEQNYNKILTLETQKRKEADLEENPELDYEQIKEATNKFGKYVIIQILNQYASSLSEEQKNMLNELKSADFIVIDRPTDADIEFFSKQEGIEDRSKFDKKYVPSAHGGRTKGDNKIHIYPYSKSFEKCKNSDEIIAHCIKDLVSHEIFHYIIRPEIGYQEDTIKADFGHFVTEGLVQRYAIEFAQNNNLPLSNSNYQRNVELVNKLMNSMPEGINLDKIAFSSSIDEMINNSSVGKEVFDDFKQRKIFDSKLSDLITRSATSAGFSDEQISGMHRYYSNISEKSEIAKDLSDKMTVAFSGNPELHQTYMAELCSLIPEHFEQSKTESDVRTETHSLEQDGPKLVRTLPQTSNSKPSANNDGKINVISILLGVSLILILITLIILFKVKL